jgi:hypothetical protein
MSALPKTLQSLSSWASLNRFNHPLTSSLRETDDGSVPVA